MDGIPPEEGRLRVAVDIGGTFTDGVATMEPMGRIWVAKSPTTPEDPGQAVSTVLEDLLQQVNATLGHGAADLQEVVHGTTLITNTLIERKGVKTALVTTKGMKDVLKIGREWRYDIYDLDIELPKPLIEDQRRVEVNARMDARGAELDPLTDEGLDALVRELSAMDADSIAVSLLHSYTNPEHEQRIGKRLQAALPGKSISLSSDLAREIKEFERTSTVAANAYVKTIVERYLDELDTRIARVKPGTPLRVMVSSGGFCSAKTGAASPILLLESGPAAGVLSALNTARQIGVSQVLAFDMGGTTAKACVAVGGEPPVTHSFECARVERFKRGSGLPILIPSIELIEIGAGGGSIAHCNRLGLLNVGPESSGSVPGPACYGRGGTDVTVTDADLLLGYLNSENFLGGSMTLDKGAAQAAVERLAAELGVPPLDATWGICNVVNENMASAARIHIAENGHDPRDFTMIATGGAGPVHAVDVARKLRIPRVIIPIAAGAGSCLGMLAAPPRSDRAWSRPQLLAEVDWRDVASNLAALQKDAAAELEAAGATTVEWTVGAEMRYEGQGAELSVALPFEALSSQPGETLLNAFESQYEKLYGRLVPDAAPQVITWRLVGRAPNTGQDFEWGDDRIKSLPVGSRDIYLPLRREFAAVPVYDRYSTQPGTTLQGPLILEERESTIVVAAAADVSILSDLTVSVAIKEFDYDMSALNRVTTAEADERTIANPQFDPIELEILWKRLISIVDEASAAFVRTCFSTLVRDGNDFAIVLTDTEGRSLAQSTMSLPGFIGCLPATVRHFLNKYPAPTMKPGDVFITNDPWKGSGHVHDVTTVTPLFHKDKLVGFAGVCSHLPDIGGKLRSNSSREIYEEGLQIPMMKLLDGGKPNEVLIEMITRNIRVPEQGMGDIWAQVAGCRTMGERLHGLLDVVNLDDLGAEVRRRSEMGMRDAIRRIPDGVYHSQVQHDGFEEPVIIKCALTVKGDTIEIDYAGTSAQLPYALNVVPIYTRAYTVYGIKAVLCPDIPNNEGSFVPITTRAPEGSLLNPTYPAASGGRSAIGHLLPHAVFQAWADVMPDRIWAAGSPNSSLTMSGEYRSKRFAVVNFLNAGQGANAKRPGFSATSFPANLGNTPVEMMESLAPIRVLRRELRTGSGGSGKYEGGCGLRFEFEVLDDASDVMTSFLMTQCKSPTKGMVGGGEGKPGQLLVNGERTDPTMPRVLAAGDTVMMETAGGGGYGTA